MFLNSCSDVYRDDFGLRDEDFCPYEYTPTPRFFPSRPASTYWTRRGHVLYLLSPRPLWSTRSTERQTSNPMKSASCSGPIGWLVPNFIPVSMSSLVATPVYSAQNAETGAWLCVALKHVRHLCGQNWWSGTIVWPFKDLCWRETHYVNSYNCQKFRPGKYCW